jgi:hypothetical protein
VVWRCGGVERDADVEAKEVLEVAKML